MLGKTLHHGDGDGAAGAAGDVVKDAGDVDRVRRLGEVAVHALGIGLVVIGRDEQQRVGAHVLILDALFDLGGSAVGTAAHDDGHPAAYHLDGVGHHGGVLLVGHGGVLTSGAQGQNAVGPGSDLALQQLGQDFEVYGAVLVEGRDHGDDGTLQMFEFHCSVLHTFRFPGAEPK